jgi:hypothetical protein
MSDGDDDQDYDDTYNDDEMGYSDDDLGSDVAGSDTTPPSNVSEVTAGSLGGDESAKGRDWEVCGVAGVGGASELALGSSMWMFRSQMANCLVKFVFVGAGVGGGGDLGGAGAPSPTDVARGTASSSWTRLQCNCPFSVQDLNWASGRITSLGAAFAYGYSACFISAGSFPSLFNSQDVSGWGTGVGLSGSLLLGVWKQLGSSTAYS